jgi:hypothetical protein
MSDFAIEKQIPLPKRHQPSKYPWKQMEVGDSFFVATDTKRKAIQFGAMASDTGKRLGCKFATRQVDGGIRIWRVA